MLFSCTQTGLERLDGARFNRGFALLSSPDVIKTLQNIPGVTGGTELLSGLHVYGGDGNDNLFMLDGVPMYQVSHLAGLFSSFNADLIDNVDFYKSGFPAIYGGRMSSVVDITTRDGDFRKYHGTFSLGLLDGRLHFEGPIVKDRNDHRHRVNITASHRFTKRFDAYIGWNWRKGSRITTYSHIDPDTGTFHYSSSLQCVLPYESFPCYGYKGGCRHI